VDRGPRDYKDLIQCEVAVHRSIWALAGDPLLTEQLERVLLPFMLTLLKVVNPRGDAEEAFRLQMSRERDGHPAAHRVLLEKICTRDPELARRAMLAHLLWSRKHNWSRRTIDAVCAAFPETKNLDTLAGEQGPLK
jgi:DNA-binding GntR family transcriptional regulator